MVTWTRQADFTAFLVFRGLITKTEFIKNYENSIGSLNMKLLNYGYLAGLNNYNGISNSAKNIYETYNELNDATLLFVYQHFSQYV